ncbi:MAG: exodeoxyribonuclease VII small subunit [Polyangiales bacterium]
MNASPETLSLEDILTRLQQVVETLEKGDLPLEESLQCFEEGVKLTREGQRRLELAEKRVDQLLASGGADGGVTVQRLQG